MHTEVPIIAILLFLSLPPHYPRYNYMPSLLEKAGNVQGAQKVFSEAVVRECQGPPAAAQSLLVSAVIVTRHNLLQMQVWCAPTSSCRDLQPINLVHGQDLYYGLRIILFCATKISHTP